jgi:hypothetical protein
MPTDQLKHEIEIEAQLLEDIIYTVCDPDADCWLIDDLRHLEVDALASVYYLIAHQDLSLADALREFDQVFAFRMPRESACDIAAGSPSFETLPETIRHQRIYIDGCEWRIVDNR